MAAALAMGGYAQVSLSGVRVTVRVFDDEFRGGTAQRKVKIVHVECTWLEVVEILKVLCFVGEPGGSRTHDPLIKSQMLYH
jgi:hypothetical protein